MPNPCMPIRKSRLAASVLKKCENKGPRRLGPERLRPAMRAFDHGIVQMCPQRVQRVIRIADVAGKRARTGSPQILIGDRRVDIFLAALFEEPKRDASVEQSDRSPRPAGARRRKCPSSTRREHRLRAPERFDQIENRRGISHFENDRSRAARAGAPETSSSPGLPRTIVPMRVVPRVFPLAPRPSAAR